MATPGALPARLRQLLASLAGDGRTTKAASAASPCGGSTPKRWRSACSATGRRWPRPPQLRRAAASHAARPSARLPAGGARGTDLLAETTLGRLLAAIEADLLLKSEVREMLAAARPRAALAARAGSDPPQQGAGGLPPGDDHPPRRRLEAAVPANPTSRRCSCITTNRWCRFTSWPSTCSAACRRWPMRCA
jgi:hypothetical protein